MFYVLSRFFTLLSSPVIYIFLLLVTAVFVSGRRLRYFCVWGALFLFLLFTNRWVYQQAEEWWTGSTLSSVEPGRVYPYGLVLGGFASYGSKAGQIDFSDSADRLWGALMLYKQGVIRKLVIVSDGSTDPEYGNEPFFRSQLAILGVPSSDLLVEPASRNTRENAQFVARMIPDLSDGPFLLITSAVHMRRSLASFREVGLRPDYYSTDRYERPYQRWENWIPDPRLFKEWYGLGHEWIGWIAYRLTR